MHQSGYSEQIWVQERKTLQVTQVNEIVVHDEEEVEVEHGVEVQLVSLMQAQREAPNWLSPKSYEVSLGKIQHSEVDHVLEVVLDITGGRQTSLLSRLRPWGKKRS